MIGKMIGFLAIKLVSWWVLVLALIAFIASIATPGRAGWVWAAVAFFVAYVAMWRLSRMVFAAATAEAKKELDKDDSGPLE